MAKIKQKLLNYYYNKQIKSLKHKILYNEAYPSILAEKLTLKKDAKVNQMAEKHRKELLELEKKTLTKEEFLEVFASEDVKKLDEKLYWKKRALNHWSNKKQQKEQLDTEKHNHLYQEKLTQIEAWYQTKKENILEKYAIEKQMASTLNAHKKEYKEQKALLAQKLNHYEADLKKMYEEKLHTYVEKTELKTKALKEKLSKTKLAKDSAIKDVLDDRLGDDELIRLDDLTMRFGGLVAVDKLSFSVKKGEIFGLIGPNGAGKTTVFNCITQFYKTPEGNIYYRDRNQEVLNLNDIKVHDIIRQGIVRTFQNVELIWELSVLDNLLVSSHTLYQTGFFQHVLHTPRFKREEAILKNKALKILEDLGLIMYKDFPPLGLPYGTLKLIEFARTLMTDPQLIILDEPAAGLNESETKQLAKSIRTIQKKYNCTIFLVEHDMGLVMELCDTICAISFGKKLAIGTPSEIQSSKIVQEAYLGGE